MTILVVVLLGIGKDNFVECDVEYTNDNQLPPSGELRDKTAEKIIYR